MTSPRASLEQKHDISSQQRTAASLFWGELLHGERKIAPTKASSTDNLQKEIAELLTIKDPTWHNKFATELDSLIFEHRHEPNLKLESHKLPQGVLLEAAEHCKIPLGVFPNNVSMSFTKNNDILVNGEQYSANQITKNNHGFFAKPKSPASKDILNTLKTKSTLLTLGLLGATIIVSTFAKDEILLNASKLYSPL